MKTVTLRMDDSTKDELDQILASMGMNIATFYNLYTLRTIRDRKIPFEITAAEDPFYSDSNMRHLQRSKEQIRQGKVVVKTMEELEAMADE